MKKFFKYLPLLILINASCSSNSSINIQNKSFITRIGIYSLNDDILSKNEFQKIIEAKLNDFKEADSTSSSLDGSNKYSFNIIDKHSTDYSPPDISALKYFGRGLSEKEELKLQNYKHLIVIVFEGNLNDIFNKQKRISEAINELTNNKDVIIADLNSVEWFKNKVWVSNRVKRSNNDVINQITIHTYRTGEYCRAVTMGMDKFGLPDISIKDFPCSDQNTYLNLINVVIQHLVENPNISSDSTLSINLRNIKNEVVRNHLRADLKKSAKETTIVKLKFVRPDEGDNENRQLLVTFENKEFSSPQEEQEKIISELFGSEDNITVTSHDTLLLNASEKARQRLPELKKIFNKGLEPGYSILVKAPFKIENGGNEWMWVEITKWNNNSITGILQNDPSSIKNLKAGAIVNVQEQNLFDYILYKPDGSSEGNETGKIIEKRE